MVHVIHADHGVTEEHLTLIAALAPQAGFFLLTIDLPEGVPSLLCGLHGPLAGDPPVPSSEVHWATRGERTNLSRLCDRAPRETRRMTCIGNVEDVYSMTIYTAYGGELAPREITDPTLPADAAEESAQFWAVHALSAPTG